MKAPLPAARHALLLSAILAVVWSVAAALRPSSTFHLAPILVTLGGAVLTASVERGRPGWVIIVATGGALGIATGVSQPPAGWSVPRFSRFGGPAAEAIVFTVGTAVVGSAAGLTGRLTSA